MVKTKLVKSTGRWGVRYGKLVKRKTASIEAKQRKKQVCPFCRGRAKRTSKGIWECKRCKKRFAGHAFYLETPKELLEQKTFKPQTTDKTKEKVKKSK